MARVRVAKLAGPGFTSCGPEMSGAVRRNRLVRGIAIAMDDLLSLRRIVAKILDASRN
jgi:hypothetical protein